MRTNTVKLRIEGRNIERFINDSVKQGISLHNTCRVAPSNIMYINAITATIALKDFYPAVSIIKKHRLRMHIEKKKGFRFFLAKNKSRYVLIWGWLIILLALFLLSQRVWFVEVKGCYEIEQAEVYALLEEYGVFPGIVAKTELLKELPGKLRSADERIAWAGVRLIGVKLYVSIVEAELPPNTNFPTEPRNLYAKSDGVVVDIIATKGIPMVKKGAAVKKGDILISGDISTETVEAYVRAEGKVIGRVLYTFAYDAPPAIQKLVRSGESKTYTSATLFGITVKPKPYGEAEIESNEKRRLVNCFFPIIFETETAYELVMGEATPEAEELKQYALIHAEELMLASLSKECRIVSKKSETVLLENGGVRAIISVVVEESLIND
ncbi:MAG TPA: sporulation protein YqfD [Clostridiales bacterium]|jgi:similar to stage IV sporulation protein|nr:sporulation protein YqfD [Clostridiales bacterium]